MFQISEEPLSYHCTDFAIKTERGKKSKFDLKICKSWDIKNAEELFKYNYKEAKRKPVPGKYRFLAELNIARAELKRESQSVSSLTMPFNPEKFHFGKVNNNEVLFEIIPQHWEKDECEDDASMSKHLLLINVSPIGYGSSLLVPNIEKCYPQMLTENALRLALETILISRDPALRMGMNSLGAFASVNHLHFHLYYLEETLYLQYAPVKKIFNQYYITIDYPAECFAFQLLKTEEVLSVVRSVMDFIKFLQGLKIAYNIFITRGTSFSEEANVDAQFNAVRIYVWARIPFFGAKNNAAFNPAVCELAGHLLIKDKTFFEEITENCVFKILYDICDNRFTMAGICLYVKTKKEKKSNTILLSDFLDCAHNNYILYKNFIS